MGAPLGSLAWLLPPTRAAQCHCRSPVCLPQPRGMTQQQYIDSCLPLAMLVLLCLLQVYMYRLRRAIAAFYFPKVSGGTDPRTPDPAHPQGLQFFLGGTHSLCPAQREKSRVLYLYNKLLRQRHCFVRLQRKRIARRARRYPALVSGDGDTGLVPHQGAGPPLPTLGWAAQGVPRSLGSSYLPHWGGRSSPRGSWSPTCPRPCCRGRPCWSGAAGAGHDCAVGCAGRARCAGSPSPPRTTRPAPRLPVVPRTAGPAGGMWAVCAPPAPPGTTTSLRTAVRSRRGTQPEGARHPAINTESPPQGEW